MKILITGADGFIGSHLAERLVKKGHKVKAFVTRDSIGILLKTKKEQIDIDYKSDLAFARQFV